MSTAKIRKVSFFFPIQQSTETTPQKHDPYSDKQLVRSFLVGQNVLKNSQKVSKIDERTGDDGFPWFDIYISPDGKASGLLWKTYTPRVSDVEIEYNI